MIKSIKKLTKGFKHRKDANDEFDDNGNLVHYKDSSGVES